MNYALTESERQAFWAYHNGGRRIDPVMVCLNCSVHHALDVLERIEIKLMRQANHYLRATPRIAAPLAVAA